MLSYKIYVNAFVTLYIEKKKQYWYIEHLRKIQIE